METKNDGGFMKMGPNDLSDLVKEILTQIGRVGHSLPKMVIKSYKITPEESAEYMETIQESLTTERCMAFAPNEEAREYWRKKYMECLTLMAMSKNVCFLNIT